MTAAAGTAASEPSGAGAGSPWAVLCAHPRFRRYWVANALSNVGTWAQAVVLTILVYDATGSVGDVALINFARFFGMLALPPLGGRIADRHDRAAVLALAQWVSGGLALLLFVDYVVTGSTFGRIFLLAVGIGLCEAISAPVMQALIPALVQFDELPVALALNSTSFNVARATGPLLGAAGAVIDPGVVLGANVASFVGLALVAGSLRQRDERGSGAVAATAGGLRQVLRRPQVIMMLVSVSALSLAMEPVNTLSPAVASEGLGTGTSFAGVLVGCFGSGAVLAVFVLGRVSASPRSIGIAMVVTLVGFVPMWFWVVRVPVLMGLVLAGAGFLMAGSMATSTIHAVVSDEYRGRAMGIWTLCYLGSRPLASLLTGALGEAFGFRIGTAVMGLPLLVTALVLLRRPRIDGPPPRLSRAVAR